MRPETHKNHVPLFYQLCRLMLDPCAVTLHYLALCPSQTTGTCRLILLIYKTIPYSERKAHTQDAVNILIFISPHRVFVLNSRLVR